MKDYASAREAAQQLHQIAVFGVNKQKTWKIIKKKKKPRTNFAESTLPDVSVEPGVNEGIKSMFHSRLFYERN